MSDDLSEHAHVSHTPNGNSLRVEASQRRGWEFTNNTFYDASSTETVPYRESGMTHSAQAIDIQQFYKWVSDTFRGLEQRIYDLENVSSQPTGSVKWVQMSFDDLPPVVEGAVVEG